MCTTIALLFGWKCPWFGDRLLNALVCPLGAPCIDLLPQTEAEGYPLLSRAWVREPSRACLFRDFLGTSLLPSDSNSRESLSLLLRGVFWFITWSFSLWIFLILLECKLQELRKGRGFCLFCICCITSA